MTEAFDRVRDRLWGIAYRMLGTPEDADDVVQDAQVRWLEADRAAIRDAEGWLVVVTTRLAIDRLRRAEKSRAGYVGPWLAAPVVSPSGTPGADVEAPDRRVELASDLSLAFLYLLERLGPEERAAFLLREAFGIGYERIAEVLDRNEAACRQMVRRARARVRDGPRRRGATPEEHRALAERFARAVESEDLDELTTLLAPDATHVTDGGGKAWAALRVISGADAVARGMLGAHRKALGGVRPTLKIGTANGEPAVLRYVGVRLVSVTTIEVRDGRVGGVFSVLNPDKLHAGRAGVAGRG